APDGSKSFGWEPKGARMEDQPLWRSWHLTDGPVIFVEGEKACEACWAAGYQAVTNAGGSGQTKFGSSLEVLRGRDVLLWPDNDEPGAKLMDRLAVLLAPIAASVKRINWPDAPPKGDAYDAIA